MLLLVLLPFVLLRWLHKSRAIPAYRARLKERFGFYSSSLKRNERPIWIHAVSVGECEAAFPLVRRLMATHPEIPLLLTTTTPTGSSRVRAVLGDSVAHVYLPYDLLFCVRRFLNFFDPCMGLIMETEIWPNLFISAKTKNIPLLILNARLSLKSVRGYQRLHGLARPALASVRCVLAQTQEDAARYVRVGVDPSRVSVAGNLKYDLEWSEAMASAACELRRQLFRERTVILAGSTHPGEEELLLEAFSEVLKARSKCVLILVPRHPERAGSLKRLAESRGYSTVFRSESRAPNDQENVFIVDGIGELRLFYGTSDVAFIGGSLVPHGGQNPLEPLVQGVPVLFGPFMSNFLQPRGEILKTGAGLEVQDAPELALKILWLLAHPKEATAMGLKGQEMIKRNQGALKILPPEP